MTDRLFTDCCYGTDQQHPANEECPLAFKFVAGQRVGWTSSARNSRGMLNAIVIGPLPESDFDLEEVGPMYALKLFDDSEVHAFQDEMVACPQVPA